MRKPPTIPPASRLIEAEYQAAETRSRPVARPAREPEDDPLPAQWMLDRAPGPLEVAIGTARRHWLLILLVTALGIAAGLAASSTRERVFRARGSLEILEPNQEFLNFKQIFPFSEAGLSTVPADIHTHVRILESETMLERALNRADKESPAPSDAPPRNRPWWKPQWSTPRPATPPSLEDRVDAARRNIEIRADNQTRIIELYYEDGDPGTAARFVNALCAEFAAHNLESRTETGRRTGERLAAQLREQRAKLEASENALQQYARGANLLFTADKTSAAEQKLRNLQDELSKTRADRLARQSRYEMAVGARGAFMPEILNDAAAAAHQARLADLKRQHSDMSVLFHREYPKLKRLEAQIAAVESDIESTRRAILQRIENEYREAARREELLTRDVGTEIHAYQQDAGKLIRYDILNREVESNRRQYEAMLERVKEAGIASAMRVGNVRPLDFAKPPRVPVQPRPSADAGLGGAVGLLAGFLLAIWREHSDRTLRKPGDLESVLSIPELGAIPRIAGAEYRAESHVVTGEPALPLLAGPAGAEETGAIEMRSGPPLLIAGKARAADPRLNLTVWRYPRSHAAESFRAAVTSILFSGEDGRTPRIVVVTSGGPGEGKSTVACNLAAAAAEMHQRVLLIDADIRDPRLHDWFGVSNDFGLMDYDPGDLSADALRKFVHKTIVDGLHVLPSGVVAGGRVSQLSADTLRALLATAGEEFDMVLVDTPPMLMYADARRLGRVSDGIVLVVRAGETPQESVLTARRRLARDGTPFLGAILNGWNAQASPLPYATPGAYRKRPAPYRLGAASGF